MTFMDCPARETLCAFALGDLPDRELCDVGEHLDRCRRCEEWVSQLDGLSDTILADLRRMADSEAESGGDTTEAGEKGHPEPAPAAGREWGDFRIIRELGRGGMGVVYEGYTARGLV